MIKHTCPFGSQCKKTNGLGEELERCRLFIEMQVTNNLTNEVKTQGECALTWSAILQHEANSKIMGVQQATESFRNEMVKATQTSSELMAVSIMHQAKPIIGLENGNIAS